MDRPTRQPPQRQERTTRVPDVESHDPGTLVVCALLGMLAGLAGSFVQGYRWFGQPSGVYLALAVSALVFFACGRSASRRAGALCAGVTWTIAVAALWVGPRAEGDVVFPGTWASEAWIYGGLGIALFLAVLPYDLIGYRAMVRYGWLEADPHGHPDDEDSPRTRTGRAAT